jgi:hypothetical protein
MTREADIRPLHPQLVADGSVDVSIDSPVDLEGIKSSRSSGFPCTRHGGYGCLQGFNSIAMAWISLVPIFSAVGATCWRVFNASLVAMSSLFAAIGAKSGASIASSPQMPLRIPLNKEIKKCTY